MWDAACSISSQSAVESAADVIWLHPTCASSYSGNSATWCVMFLGGTGSGHAAVGNFSLSNAELNSINSSGAATLYLGDRYSAQGDVDALYVSGMQLAAASSVAADVSLGAAQIEFTAGASEFHDMNVNVLSESDLLFVNSSSLWLQGNDADAAHLLLQTNVNCDFSGASKLSLCRGCSIVTTGGATLALYGSDLEIDNNGDALTTATLINASESSIVISERCSSTYSMAIGGAAPPLDSNTYLLHLRADELQSLYCRDLSFESYDGAIHVSGFDQSTDMAGVSGGELRIAAASQNGSEQWVRFDDAATSFAANSGGVTVAGFSGIVIAKNVSNADGVLRLEFADEDLTISRDVWLRSLGSSGNIEFVSGALAPASIVLESLPVVIEAPDATANISIDVPMQVQRNSGAEAELHMFVGGTLEFSAPHSWLRLHGDSAHAARLNLESARLVLSSTIVIAENADADAGGDTIWLHPTCSASAVAAASCSMQIGGPEAAAGSTNYSLSDAELDRINSSLSPASTTLRLGDIDTESNDIGSISLGNISTTWTCGCSTTRRWRSRRLPRAASCCTPTSTASSRRPERPSCA